MGLSGFDERLARERRARLQAERLLALRSEELYSANRKLAEHAHALSHQVIEQREENAVLQGQTSKANAALEIATEKAVLAERRLWDSLTAAEDGFAIFDTDCRLVVANPAWLDAFDGLSDVAPGASYEAILRIACDEGLIDLQGATPEDWIDQMLARWEATPIPRIDIKLWNGAYVRLIDKRTPQGDTVCLGLDITDTIRREKELEKARDAALAASRAKSAFLANMSHEIRTPMNGVVSMAELLQDSGLTEEQALFADTIRNSGEALLEIINDILDYSKIEAGKLVLHEDSFDLEAMVQEIFRLLRPSTEGRALDLRLEYDLSVPDRVIGDRGRVRQVLTNLIGNAVKFTEAGQVCVKVTDAGETAETQADAAMLRIEVADTGVGIASDMQAHVFGEFNQVEDQANRRHDGTGLGLAITRKLVGLMGGQMWLESEVGRGSTFGFSLPVRRAPDARPAGLTPLPDDARRVFLVTGPDGAEVAPALRDALRRLRAEVTGPGPVSPAPEADTVIFQQTPGDGSIDALRTAGFQGRICVLPGTEEIPPEGCLALPADLDLLGLRDALAAPAPVPMAQPAAPTDPEPRPETEEPAASGRLRLLAAEDNRTNQLVFKSMIKALDLDLELVEDGAKLVAAYTTAPPDLILTDISMPGMDGTEATRLIRAHEVEKGLPRVPIIAMTAHAMAEDRDRILAAGIDDYLTKPLKKAELHDKIAAHAPAELNPVNAA